MEDGPPMFNQDITCPSLLIRVLSSTNLLRVRDYHPLWSDFPDCSTHILAKSHRAHPLSLAATKGISFDFFSSGYLDVSVPRVCLYTLCIQI